MNQTPARPLFRLQAVEFRSGRLSSGTTMRTLASANRVLHFAGGTLHVATPMPALDRMPQTEPVRLAPQHEVAA